MQRAVLRRRAVPPWGECGRGEQNDGLRIRCGSGTCGQGEPSPGVERSECCCSCKAVWSILPLAACRLLHVAWCMLHAARLPRSE
jgi:hypothetical protein